MRRLATCLCVALLIGCSEDPSGESREAVSAQQLAEELGCETFTPPVPDPGEPIQPLEDVACQIGEAGFGIRLYQSRKDRAQVLDYLHQFDGFRSVGPNWIIAVDTPEAARTASQLLGGDFVTLRGTAPG